MHGWARSPTNLHLKFHMAWRDPSKWPFWTSELCADGPFDPAPKIYMSVCSLGRTRICAQARRWLIRITHAVLILHDGSFCYLWHPNVNLTTDVKNDSCGWCLQVLYFLMVSHCHLKLKHEPWRSQLSCCNSSQPKVPNYWPTQFRV